MAYDLSNPKRIPCEMHILSEKLKSMSLLLSWTNAGNTKHRVGSLFHYIFGLKKPHILDNGLANIVKVDHEKKIVYYKGTAATNGKYIKYSEDVLLFKSPLSVLLYELHELNHIIFDHTNIMRVAGRNKKVWNWAIDYKANNSIEHGFRVIASNLSSSDSDTNKIKNTQEGRILLKFSKDINHKYPENDHPLWNGDNNRPYYLDTLLTDLKNSVEKFLHPTETSAEEKKKQHKDTSDYEKRWYLEENEYRIFVDYSVNHLSPEEIYDKIMEIVKPAQDKFDDLLEQMTNMHSSDHETCDLLPQDLLGQLLEAKKFCSLKGIGKDPFGALELIDQLINPELTAEQIIRNHVAKTYTENGQRNNWSKFRRRAISMDLYIPKKKDPVVNYLAVLDTSGSMANHDMVLGISQLQALEGKAKGTIIFNDADAYWEHPIPIKSVSDLKNLEAIGRGGTVFAPFFEEWERHFSREKVDFIIIMTDGGIFDLNELKHPRKDVFWILTMDVHFDPPFGRVARLRNKQY